MLIKAIYFEYISTIDLNCINCLSGLLSLVLQDIHIASDSVVLQKHRIIIINVRNIISCGGSSLLFADRLHLWNLTTTTSDASTPLIST